MSWTLFCHIATVALLNSKRHPFPNLVKVYIIHWRTGTLFTKNTLSLYKWVFNQSKQFLISTLKQGKYFFRLCVQFSLLRFDSLQVQQTSMFDVIVDQSITFKPYVCKTQVNKYCSEFTCFVTF